MGSQDWESQEWDGETERVGFFIYGASMENLPVSQKERIEAAFRYATENYPCEKGYEHVYFPSGFKAEAYYIQDGLKELYRGFYAEQPYEPKYTIILEPNARFTVQNVLLSLPKLNAQPLDHLCLVTSDYHMDRASAIYDQFIAQDLCRYETYHKVPAFHTKWEIAHNPLEEKQNFREDHSKDTWFKVPTKELQTDDEFFLNAPVEGKCKCGREHQTTLKEIKCPARDRSNAAIFCDYINQVKAGRTLDDVKIKENDVQQYLFNNRDDKASETPDSPERQNEKFGWFKRDVRQFAIDSKFSGWEE